MQVYWLTDRTNGEAILVDAFTLERLLGVELRYVEWCIRSDGLFENGEWKVCRISCTSDALIPQVSLSRNDK